jgi:Ca2+-binding RTX toxin-like protein
MYPSSPAQKASAQRRSAPPRCKSRRPDRIEARQFRALVCAVEQLERRQLMAAGPTLPPNAATLIPQIQFMSSITTGPAGGQTDTDHPIAAASADFNRDGFPDLVTSGGTTANIDLWLSNGKGSFNANGSASVSATANPIIMATGGQGNAVAIAVGDLNGDGRPDIVVADSPTAANNQGSVTVFLGNGNGTFRPPVVYRNVGANPDAVIIGDFNGFPDIVVASKYSLDLTELLGNGSGSFETVTTGTTGKTTTTYNESAPIPVESEPIALAAAHMQTRSGTLDSNMDLVVLNGFASTEVLPNGKSVVVGGTVSVLYGNGDGNFQPQYVSYTGVTAPPPPAKHVKANFIGSDADLQVMQLDPNSSAEALVIGKGDQITVMYQNGDGSFTRPVSAITKYAFADEVVAKAFGDGYGYEVVQADGSYYGGNNTVTITPISGSASLDSVTLGQPQVFPVGLNPSAVVVADVNGDGNPDILTANYSYPASGGILSATVLLGNGSGKFQSQELFSQNPGSIVAAVPSNLPGNVPAALNYPRTSTAVAIADFNGDGNPDVAAIEPGALKTVIFKNAPFTYALPGYISVFLGNGDGTFQDAVTYAAGPAPTAIAVGNFDGFPSIVVTNGGTANRPGNTVTILLGDGRGHFAPETYYVGLDPVAVGVGNFNGNPDIVVANNRSASLTVLLGDGGGGFATETISTIATPSSLTVDDFNHDGNPDIAVGFSKYSDIETFLGSGDGKFHLDTKEPLISLPLSGTSVLASGDLTDTLGAMGPHQDIVAGSTTNAAITILRGNGDGTFYVEQVYDTAPSTGAQTLYVTDMNGDGYPDIVYGVGGTVETLLNTSSIVQRELAANTPGVTVQQLAIFETGAATAVFHGTTGALGVGQILSGTDPRNDGLPGLFMPSTNDTTVNETVQATITEVLSLPVLAVPVITTPATSTVFMTGQAGTFGFTATGTPPALITETGILPRGVTFVDNPNGTAVLEGTPAVGSGGIYSLTIGATNTTGTALSEQFTLLVEQPPMITSASSATVVVGASTPISIISTGFPRATISETNSLPGGLTFTASSNGTAVITGTPAANSAGTYVLDFMAGNGLLPNADQSFTLTVVQAPVLSGATSVTFNAGTAASVMISATASPVAAITESGPLPAGVTFTDNGNGTATLAGTAAAGTGGSYVLTITAANGSLPNASETFTLSVRQAPMISGGNSATFTTGSSGSFTISSTGFPTAALSETGLLPSGVTFQDNGDGTATLSGTPDLSLGNSTYNITINAVNGIMPSASEAFSITVNASATIRSVGGVVYVTGTVGADTGNMSVSGGNLVVLIDQLGASFALSSVTGINIALVAGNDSFSIGAGVPAVSINGGGGSDTIVAQNNAPNTLNGGAGDDSVTGGGGNQSLLGGAGNDTLVAGSGTQTLSGGDGADSLVGGSGMDVLSGGTGPDTLISGGAQSSLYGGSGHDSIISGAGFSLLDGGLGTDTIVAGITDTVTDTVPGSMIFQ